MEQVIQREIAIALNQARFRPWQAIRAISRDGTEYVDFSNPRTGERYVITITKVL